ncbi:MAG: hypothetical protein ACFFBD_24280, partial [Candidatus Hodarchaeota archaeon]
MEEQSGNQARIFNLGIIIFVLIGSILFFIILGVLSSGPGSVPLPIALPLLLLVIFYEGVIKKR